jgi:hypothetical protein
MASMSAFARSIPAAFETTFGLSGLGRTVLERIVVVSDGPAETPAGVPISHPAIAAETHPATKPRFVCPCFIAAKMKFQETEVNPHDRTPPASRQ